MIDKELKRLIGGAYQIEPENKEAFIRKYRRRELNYAELLVLQLKYMGVALAAAFGYIMALTLGVIAETDAGLIKATAYFMPLAALTLLAGVGRSEKHGMRELEMSTRFSLRMIRVMRLVIIGTAGVAVITVHAFVWKAAFSTDLFLSAAFACIPYFITTALCMMLIRRWHSEYNIYGCAVITGACLLLIPLLERLSSMCTGDICRLMLTALLILAVLMTVSEAVKYVKESEELQWNLC